MYSRNTTMDENERFPSAFEKEGNKPWFIL